MITYKAINGLATKYISDLITIKAESSYPLRSNNELLLAHPRVRTKTTLGDRAIGGSPEIMELAFSCTKKINIIGLF